VDEREDIKNYQERMTVESVDDSLIGLMRLILALSGLIIIVIDPSEPDHFVEITYAALVLYTLYSGVVYFLSLRGRNLFPICFAPWIDVGCFSVIVALSSGTGSIFFFFFFFAVMVASFRGGFSSGLRVTIVSTLLFTSIGFATLRQEHDFRLNRFLLRPIYLTVLGYMIAYWGGREVRLKRRLSLLKEVTKLSNPRFGVRYTIGIMLKKLQTYYEADDCMLVLIDPLNNETRLFRLGREDMPETVRAERLPPKLEQLLLSPSENIAIVQAGKRQLFRDSGTYALNLETRSDCTAEWNEASAALASKLDMESFISVPLSYRARAIGRLYMTARPGVFDNSDIDFLMQVMEQIIPVIHNIRLLARHASDVAEQERKRLARDIHDSVIQPYIGLQYKLAAIRNKLSAGSGDVSEDIERLFQMTVDEVSSLRSFTRRLKDSNAEGDGFLSAVRRFALHFGDNYGLDIEVESRGEINLNDRLAAELMQIIYEGLSNIRKHTEATSSKITLERSGSTLTLFIENDKAEAYNGLASSFIPLSITERAEELGGQASVEPQGNGHTIVKVEIPL
jgi:signal transduction histidine kinase